MIKWLNKFEMNLVYIIRAIILILSLVFFGLGVWRFWMSKGFEYLALYGVVSGILLLFNIYRLNKAIKLNNDKLSVYQIKIFALQFCRAIFAALGGYYIVISYASGAVLLTFMMVLTVIGEALTKYLDAQKSQTEVKK